MGVCNGDQKRIGGPEEKGMKELNSIDLLGTDTRINPIFGDIIISIELIIIVLIGVAFITLSERKVLGSMQRRKGPNIVGIFGILQPIIDGLKLGLKEQIIPQQSNKIYYMAGPIITLTLALIIWIPIPFNTPFINIINNSPIELLNTRSIGSNGIIKENNYSILYIIAISSLSVYILLFTGWSSNSKYAFLGAIRAIAQLISYEVSIGLILMGVIIINNTLNLTTMVYNQIYITNFRIILPLAILFLISALAETNRPPFDLPEAESELIAGYLVEYGGFTFAAIYLAEYTFIQSMSVITSILFFGSSNPFIISFIIFTFIWIRATLPRIKYNNLMELGWTKILPFTISYIIFEISLIILLN